MYPVLHISTVPGTSQPGVTFQDSEPPSFPPECIFPSPLPAAACQSDRMPWWFSPGEGISHRRFLRRCLTVVGNRSTLYPGVTELKPARLRHLLAFPLDYPPVQADIQNDTHPGLHALTNTVQIWEMHQLPATDVGKTSCLLLSGTWLPGHRRVYGKKVMFAGTGQKLAE